MQELYKPSGYWTKERCKEEALKYNTKQDLRNNNNAVYQKIYNKKWIDLFSHMKKN